MEKRYKLIEVSESCCKNQEYHMTEYHDGYSDCHIICKINNEVCDEEHCKHKQLELDGFTKEEMIDKMARAMNKERCRSILKEDIYWQEDKKELLREAKAALNVLLV